MTEGPTTTGSIRGKVDLDIAEAMAKLAELKAATGDLNNGSRGTKISVDTRDAVRETDNLERSTKRTTSALNGLSGAAKRQNDWQAVMIRGLIDISIAAPPVAAAAVGIAGAMTGMGVAGALAIGGIARAMKDGTGAGTAYIGMVKNLQGSVHTLQDSAAKGLLPGASASFLLLQDHMPRLNSMVGEFAGMLGGMAPTGLDAVLTLLERAMPAFRAGGTLLQNMVQSLDDFSHSNGYGDFIQYTVQNMPQVESFLRAVIGLVGDLLTAWAPLGQETLPLLTGLVTGLDDIVKAAGPIVPVIGGIYLAFRAWGAVTGIIGLVQAGLVRLGVTATATAAEVNAATAAGGAGGRAGGGLIGALGTGAAGAVALGVAIPGFLGTAGNMAATQFGVTGPAGKSARDAQKLMIQATATGAAGSGVASAINSPIRGIRNSQVGGAFTSAVGGTSFIDTQTSRNVDSLDKTFAAMVQGGHAKQAADMVKQFAQANHLSAAEIKSAFPTYEQQKTAFAGITAQQAAAAKVQRDYAAGTAQLNGEINIATTAAFQNATSENAAEEAILSATDALKQNKGAWSAHTAAGLADRDAVASAVAAINQHAVAINSDGKHTAEAKLYTDEHIVALRAAAKAAGVSADQIDAYVAKLLGVPKSVVSKITANTVQAEKNTARAVAFGKAYAAGNYKAILRGDYSNAQKAAARAAQEGRTFANGHYVAKLQANGSPAKSAIDNVRAWLKSINGLTSTVYVNAIASGISPGRAAQINRNAYFGNSGGTSGPNGMIRGLAAGGTGTSGTVTGPGTASSDSAGVYALANGEEVISNMFGQADKWRPLLKAINANKVDYRSFEKAGSKSQPTRTTRIDSQIHVHNPVAVDPVAQTAEAAQLALANAGLG